MSDWRQANDLEAGLFDKAQRLINGDLRKAIVYYQAYASAAASLQTFADQRNLVLQAGPVFTLQESQEVQNTMQRHNQLTRLCSGVTLGKYGVRLSTGDLDVVAPPELPTESWQADQIQLGAAPIIWAIAIGAILVVGIWGYATALKAWSETKTTELRDKLIAADKLMLANPDPAIRSAWQERRRQEEKSNQELYGKTGFLVDVFGTKGTQVIYLAALALGLWFAGNMLKNRSEK